LDNFIHFKHPAMDKVNDKFYLGALLPRSKEDIKVDLAKNRFKVKTTEHILVFEDFTYLHETQFLNNDVFVNQELNQDFKGCSKKLLEAIINGNVKSESIDFKYFVDLLKHYVYFSDNIEYYVVTSYIIGSYFFDVFAYYPILHFYAERGSGKTISAKFIDLLGWNAYYTINITKAGLSRVNSQRKGVVIIDEKENINESDDLKLILNGCFQRGSREVMTEATSSGAFKLIYFDLYSPVVIASINPVFGATSDRMIRIEMMRNKVKKNLFQDVNLPLWAELRDKLYVFALSHYKDIEKIYQNWDDDFLTNRDLDIWKPLLSIIKFLVPDKIEEVKEYICNTYIPYKRDIQEGSVSSLLCDFIIEQTTDKEEYNSSLLFKNFRMYIEADAPFLAKKMSKRGFGLAMSRIGFNDKHKSHKRDGNYYIIDKQLCYTYNERYFHKTYCNLTQEEENKMVIESIGDDYDEL
jgi:hypothetical protein